MNNEASKLNRNILLLLLLALPASKAWSADSRWYLGGGIGITNFSLDSSISAIAPDLDSQESGLQLFAGGKVGSHWALETGFIYFGEAQGFDTAQNTELSYSAYGVYANGQYHIPLSKKASLDLVGGWLFGQAEAEKKSTDNPGKAKFDDNGGMLGLGFTWLSTDTVYLRGTANYFLVDFDKGIKEPWRLGVDVIWDF
jgi:hypothetical protein